MKTKLMMLAAAAAATMPTMAATQYANGYTWTYQINGDTAEIYNNRDTAVSPSPSGAVTLPSTLGGRPVTSIGSYAFELCDGLTSVTIPSSVTNIGAYAFYACQDMTCVTIPDSVTSIADRGFCYCGGLVSISVDSENPNYKSVDGLLLTKDGKTLMKGVNGDVTVPDGVMYIMDGAFAYCDTLTSLTIPSSVTSIGSSITFFSCDGLTNVTISANSRLTSIESDLFSSCRRLVSVTIPDSVLTIGSGAFSGCHASLFDTTTFLGVKLVDGWAVGNTGGLSGDLNLTGIRGIGASAFDGCNELTSVTIPDGVKSIGEWTFDNCSALTSVIIGNDVTSIGRWAFRKCSKLRSVTIPDSVTSIGNSAFEYCSRLTDLTIGNGVTNIDFYAFRGCSNLTSVTIPSSVTSIGSYAFRDSNVWRAYIPKGLAVDSVFPSNTILYRYAPNQTVTLDANGGTCAEGSVAVTFGKEYGELPTPSRFGCSFGGWTLGGKTITASTVVSSLDDHTLVAKWICTVAFDSNGGECSTETATVEHGASIGTLPVPTRANAAFRGWFTNSEGGEKIDKTLRIMEGMTLYAHWLFEVANPVIMSNGDVEFRTDSCEVTISSVTEGATIYYTDDKTTPKKNNDYLYSGPITITETTTFKAVAVVGGISSGYVTVTITKRPLTLEEALDVGESGVVSLATSTGLPWIQILDPNAKVGVAVARSGAIGNNTNTWLSASVSGAGAMSFWCKTSCEHDDDGTFTWDRLMVYTNDVEIVEWRMDGEAYWTERTLTFDGGENTVKWIYYKDKSDTDGEDCAWVDGINWTPAEPFPALPSNATTMDVATALAGASDTNLAKNITDVTSYAEFREWAESVGAATVKKSSTAWLSFAVGSANVVPIPQEGDLVIDEVSVGSDGKLEAVFSLDSVSIGSAALESRLKTVFGVEGATTLNKDAFFNQSIGLSLTPTGDGRVKAVVTPVGSPPAFFMRVKMK